MQDLPYEDASIDMVHARQIILGVRLLSPCCGQCVSRFRSYRIILRYYASAAAFYVPGDSSSPANGLTLWCSTRRSTRAQNGSRT
jgi:hypothetical protein